MKLEPLNQQMEIQLKTKNPRKVKCANGNVVERFYDKLSRSSVTRVIDKDGNQIGDADYAGSKDSANFFRDYLIRREGGISV